MSCAPGDRLRKIVLYEQRSDEIADETPVVQIIHQHLPNGLLLERYDVTELRAEKFGSDWVERDPELQDWLEANAVS